MSGLISNQGTVSSANVDDFDRNPTTGDITPKVITDSIVAQKIKTDELQVLNLADEVIAKIDTNGKIQGRSGEFGIVGAEFTKTAQADFTSIGVNVDVTVADEFGNVDEYTDETAGLDNTNTSTTSGPFNNSATAWSTALIDSFLSTSGGDLYFNRGGTNDAELIIDLGSAKQLDEFEMRSGASGNWNVGGFTGDHLIFEGSNTSSTTGFTTLYTPNSNFDLAPLSTIRQALDVTGTYRWVRITSTLSNTSFVGSITLGSLAPRSIDNTFDTRLATGSDGSFDPSTFLASDESAGLINGTGKINVAYAVDGGAFTSLVDQDTFKALGSIAYTSQFDIQLQLVGAQRFGSFVISQPSGQTMQVLSDGSVLASSGNFGLSGIISDQSVADADFTSIGANVDTTVADEFGNDTNEAEQTVSTATASGSYSGSGADLIDGSTSTAWVGPASTSANVVFDFGSTKTFDAIDFLIGVFNTHDVDSISLIEGSADNVSYSDILSTSSPMDAQYDTYQRVLVTESSYRYVRITFQEASSYPTVKEVKFYNLELESTLNTFDTNLATGSAGTFSASTFKAYDEVAALISGAGKVNVAYAVDGGNFTGVVYDLPNQVVADYNQSSGTVKTVFVSLSSLGLSGNVTLDEISLVAQTGSNSISYFVATPNGGNWDITEVGEETSVPFNVSNIHTFALPSPVTVNADTDMVGYSFHTTNLSRYFTGSSISVFNSTVSYTGDATGIALSPTPNTFAVIVRVDQAYDQEAFKALGDIAYTTQFDLQLQLVGSQRFSKATISTPNTVLQLTSDGQAQIMDSAVKVSSFGKLGVAPVSLTTAERDALTGMDDGAIIFNETTGSLNTYNGTVWVSDNEFIDTPQTTAANLETNFPATGTNGMFAWVAGTTAENGLYLSDGVTWVKQLDNSGDRSTLFDYAGGLVYSGTNNLNALSGTAVWNRSDDSTAIAIGGTGFEYDKAFDNNTGTSVQCNTSDASNLLNSYLYKTLVTPDALGKFTVTMAALYTAVTSYRLVGRDALGAFTVLTITSISGDGTQSGNNVTGLTNSDSTIITTDNTTEYESYGIQILQNGSGNTGIAEIAGETVTDNTVTIDCVRSLNKLHAGVSKIEPTALTADTLLDDTDGTVLLDPSGADFTMTLPAVATVQTGKKYTFVLTTAPATTAVTLDGNGAETINGAATNATALTAQWDTVTIMSDGTQWIIV